MIFAPNLNLLAVYLQSSPYTKYKYSFISPLHIQLDFFSFSLGKIVGTSIHTFAYPNILTIISLPDTIIFNASYTVHLNAPFFIVVVCFISNQNIFFL